MQAEEPLREVLQRADLADGIAPLVAGLWNIRETGPPPRTSGPNHMTCPGRHAAVFGAGSELAFLPGEDAVLDAGGVAGAADAGLDVPPHGRFLEGR